jgi:hypothetical protein
MMAEDRKLRFKEQLLDEIWQEIGSLKGEALDRHLSEIGLDPGAALRKYANTMDAAVLGAKRARFDQAKLRVKGRTAAAKINVVAFDLARKTEIMSAIRGMAARSNEMTIAARNQKIESEQDLDSFLEACLALGVIDEEGNLKG